MPDEPPRARPIHRSGADRWDVVPRGYSVRVTTALYRRYRPETFEDVIGQSHVTEPLMTALRKNKVNHAYLFSGPRGCGKTTSARILARCLNCAQGPTPTPCGQCESCRDLARDGAGSLDVIEMDAASHGGVDDARQLRERATFAPVRDRYKIFIIDEAHMVTRDGFNALLKIVEEPPEHIKFIFATTEPNKVLPTIRSRTHHYPFRLVPPEPLMEYLSALCEQEGVGVEPGVQAMVVRAGGGSVRDSLSVLDQLMAGTDQDEISYDLASSLLGYTHGALLDDVVDAFASGDAATVFRAVDRVVQTGQDPRRFVEDLLERFRDLVIVDAVPENAGNILHGTPEDQISRLRNQAHQMGASELSRAADITNEALTEMVGATSPQLHLELLCARLLLPSAENTTRGVGVRVDRLERRLNIGRTGAPTGPLLDVPAEQPAAPSGDRTAPAPQRPQQTAPTPEPASGSGPASEQDRPDDAAAPPARTASRDQAADASSPAPRHDPRDTQAGSTQRAASDPGPADGPSQPDQAPAEEVDPLTAAQGGFGKFRGRQPEQSAQPAQPSQPAQEQPAPAQPGARTPDQTPQRPPHADETAAQGPASGGEIDMIRNSWTEIISALADIHRVSWMTAMRGTPIAFDGSVLQLMFDAEGDRKNFPRFEPNLVQAIQQVIGVSCRVEAVGSGGPRGDSGSGPRGGGPRDSGPRDSGPRDSGPRGGGPRDSGPRDSGPRDQGPRGDGSGQGRPRGGQAPQADAGASADARSAAPGWDDRQPGGSARPGSGPDGTASGTGPVPDGGARGRAAEHGPPPEDTSPSRGGDEHDGGRATGPRPFPPREPEEKRTPSSPSGTRNEPAPDDSAEVTSWEVASIPTSDPLASAPAGPDAPAQAGPVPGADDVSVAETPEPTAPSDDHAQPPAGDAPQAPDAPDAPGAPAVPDAPDARDDVASTQSAPEQPGAQQTGAQQSEPTAPARSAPSAPRRQPRRSGAAPRGEDPSPDPVVPASPYDDIPWPDEAPPEDEPPFEDPGFASAPSGGAAARPESRPEPASAPASAPAFGSAPETAPGAEPAPASDSGPRHASGAAHAGTGDESDAEARAEQTPEAEDAPPEQWRPPAPEGAAAAAAGTPSAGTSPAGAAAGQQPEAPRKQSFRERHAAHFAAAQQDPAPRSAAMSAPDLDSEATFSPSEDDEAVENTDQSTRALIERILGGRLLEEIPHQPGL